MDQLKEQFEDFLKSFEEHKEETAKAISDIQEKVEKLTPTKQKDIDAMLSKLSDAGDVQTKIGEALGGFEKRLAAFEKTAPPSKEVKKPFKGEAAVNLDKSGKPENEFHFTHEKVNYRFNHEHITPPVTEDNAKPERVTAKAAQNDKKLQAALVKIGSGQIKEVK